MSLSIIEKDFYEKEDFTECEYLPEEIVGKSYVNCSFNAIDFRYTEITRCKFNECIFTLANFAGTKLKSSAFLNCSFKYSNLLGTTFENCKMTGSDLTEAKNKTFIIIGGEWSFSSLSNIVFKNRDMSEINFSNASLFKCEFIKCNLKKCRFDNAICTDVGFEKSDIRDASFKFVNLTSFKLKETLADLNQCIDIARCMGLLFKP